jgi:DNA integrity scanning protein DisA with diadenylate cyclase activity
MRRIRDTTSGLRLIIFVVCILFLAMPGVVFAATVDTTLPGAGAPASVVSNVTSVPTTPVPPVFKFLVNSTNAVYPPPLLIFDTPLIENLSCTVYGIVDPGSANVTIASLRVNWGDSQTQEYQGFPFPHVYSSPGTYTLSIAALQSDGQEVTEITKISVKQPVIPDTTAVTPNSTAPEGTEEPVIVLHSPVLTLFEPVIDRMNVTLNGNLNPGSPNVTIDSVSIDWNDGNSTRSASLPVTHQYSGAGIFTVSVTGNQSDGQSTTRKITLELKREIPSPPGPTPSGSPPDVLSAYLIIFGLAITGVVIVAVVLITRQMRKPHLAPDIPKANSQGAGPRRENLPLPDELETMCSGTDVDPRVLDSVIHVAVEIARDGHEGQAIGTAFVVGDSQTVMQYSKQFVLNPFRGHLEAERQIADIGIQGTIKEFAQLDGAFLITGTGVIESAGRCITVDTSQVNLPGGMGSRHSSIAGITRVTKSVGVVVSQSGGRISIFRDGKIVYKIRP